MSYTPPPPPPPGGGYSMPQTNQKAVWALVLGILSIVACGLLAGIPALIVGGSARKEIAASGGGQTGDGMAKAGVIMGWISVAITVVVVLLIAVGTFTISTTSN